VQLKLTPALKLIDSFFSKCAFFFFQTKQQQEVWRLLASPFCLYKRARTCPVLMLADAKELVLQAMCVGCEGNQPPLTIRASSEQKFVEIKTNACREWNLRGVCGLAIPHNLFIFSSPQSFQNQPMAMGEITIGFQTMCYWQRGVCFLPNFKCPNALLCGIPQLQ
jgi:hypothetical protein